MQMLRRVAKHELTPLKMEHILLFLTGIAIVAFRTNYQSMGGVAQVITLVIYLGLLVGIAPVPMPVFRKKFWQVFFAGAISSVLDSFIVLKQMKALRTVETGQDARTVMEAPEDQETEGERAKLLALGTMSAIIGGLMIWFGEVYAAGLFNNDGRTGAFSALYIVPPAVMLLCVLGLHASLLKIDVVPNKAQKAKTRDVLEFSVGILLLLLTHNPLLCLGVLVIYAVLTRQDDHLLDAWKEETEVSVMLVLIIAWISGSWLVRDIISPLGLGIGAVAPIIPAGIQAVLWGPLYEDPSVHFWVRVTTLSTGALLLPISSLVGVMLYRTPRQWMAYMKYSIPYAVFWFCLMHAWMWLTLDSWVGRLLESCAH